jgi:hypothetical protein
LGRTSAGAQPVHVEEQLFGRGERLGLIERGFEIESARAECGGLDLADPVVQFLVEPQAGAELDGEAADLTLFEPVDAVAGVERLCELAQDPALLFGREQRLEAFRDDGVAPRLGMPRVGAKLDEARGVRGELGEAGGLADGFLAGFDGAADVVLGGAGDDDVIGLGGVALTPAGADGGPESGVIEMPYADAGVPGSGRILAIAAGEFLVRGHLARGGQLRRGSHVEAGVLEDDAVGLEDGGQADLGMAVAGGDGGARALRLRQEGVVHLFGEGAQGVVIARGEGDGVDHDFGAGRRALADYELGMGEQAGGGRRRGCDPQEQRLRLAGGEAVHGQVISRSVDGVARQRTGEDFEAVQLER